MNPVLDAWNAMDPAEARTALRHCCASQRWAAGVVAGRPYGDEAELAAASDQVWATMQEPDWMQAFAAHPRIGDQKPAHASAQSTSWSSQEQAQVSAAQMEILARLAAGNVRYEELFGFTYIVCATGKSAEEMLAILERRLTSDRESELKEAAEQQRQITQIRLRKWLNP